MKLTDERIIEFIKSKHQSPDFDLERFLNSGFDDLRDALNFNNIDKIVSKIQEAISSKKRILVYGDYDSDGICASTILYLFLKSCGADVSVFIPNRFENGYGISVDAIEEIVADYSPDLIVTVDLGITAVEEVEILKQEGIDIVVTDHHLPLEETPDCLILDPKFNNENYGFDALCGAGVAMKLVEAISGRDEANKYLDVAAIATVGDIVPLIDENRAIAKLGIEKINKGDCLKSLTFLKNKLELENLTSSDISFKIVPRLNACGRMDNAIKVFEFLIETDEKMLEEKYAEIESDNTLRLASIDKGNKIIEKELESYEITEPSVLVKGDFHEGIVGILASRICSEYNKPTIVFTKTNDGTLKGSGRSIASVDLHSIIASIPDLLINFGGHKMAVGVEIAPEAFEEFKTQLNAKILEAVSENEFLIDGAGYDIEITEDDFSEYFINQVALLEPFGCDNEKPVFMIKQNKMNVEPISEKAFKHYRCFTAQNKVITGFNFFKNTDICKTDAEKQFLVDVTMNHFKGKSSVNVIAKGLQLKSVAFEEDKSQDYLASLYNLYYSIFDFNNKDNYHISNNLEDVIKTKFAESNFGTAVVASTKEDYEVIKRLNLEKYISHSAYSNAQNVVIASPHSVYELSEVKGYKNIIFLHRYFDEEHLYFSQNKNVYESAEKTVMNAEISKEREVCARVYKLACNFAPLKANNIVDFVNKLSIKDGTLSKVQIMFSLIVFMELNFLEFDEILNCFKVLKAKKVELSNSKFYNAVD